MISVDPRSGYGVGMHSGGLGSVTLCFLLLLLAGCASLPERGPLDESMHFAAPELTELGRRVQSAGEAHPEHASIRILDRGDDALLERAALIEAAERSMDAQYYIWNSDRTGRYLAGRIYAAAERGVRVRLLIDDINVAGRDAVLAALDDHRNIELRIYNPFAARQGVRKSLGFVSEWARLNRRMHNKSFTVDGAVTIVGGRNIGDEYFDGSESFNFVDRDVTVTGAVVASVGSMFDAFWNSGLTYPVSSLSSKRLSAAEVEELIADAESKASELSQLGFDLPADGAAGLAVYEKSLSSSVWAPVSLVHDDPPSAIEPPANDELQPSAKAFGQLVANSTEEVLIESAYLVLDDASLVQYRSLIERGVRVVAETNSLASNDVTGNHAAYARRRKAILESGVELYELRPDAEDCQHRIANGCDAHREVGLHAKSFVFDRSIVWVGSFNLNLRSAYLNAEAGMIIESPELAAAIAADILARTQDGNSWRVRMVQGRVRWSAEGGKIYTSEPETGWWRRLKVAIIAALPLEKYL